jgi:hypothetical protein
MLRIGSEDDAFGAASGFAFATTTRRWRALVGSVANADASRVAVVARQATTLLVTLQAVELRRQGTLAAGVSQGEQSEEPGER